MAYKVFNPQLPLEQAISAGEVNTYLMRQANIVCLSTGRPANPQVGMRIFELDMRTWRMWDGTAWVYDQIVPGTIHDFGGGTVPGGYLACDGSAVSRTTYAALFAEIATTWGVGDGSTTFNVPEIRGRTTIGSGTGPGGLTARTLGDFTIGTETYTLTAAQLASHTHGVGTSDNFIIDGSGSAWMVAGPEAFGPFNTASATNAAGSGNAHPNVQPSAVVTKMVKT